MPEISSFCPAAYLLVPTKHRVNILCEWGKKEKETQNQWRQEK